MLRQVIEYVQQLLLLARETQENRRDIEKLKTRLEDLSRSIQALTFEFERFQAEERHEREKLMLRLENALLKFERQSPLVKDARKTKR